MRFKLRFVYNTGRVLPRMGAVRETNPARLPGAVWNITKWSIVISVRIILWEI